MKNKVAFLFAVLVAVATDHASASLVGDNVNAAVVANPSNPFSVSPGSAVVTDPGVEFILGSVVFPSFTSVDVMDSSFRVQNTFGSGFIWSTGATLTLSDLDWVGQNGVITGVSLVNVIGVSGLDVTDLSFDAHSVTVNLGDSSYSAANSGFDVLLSVSHTVAVPEPTTATLGLMGIAGLVMRRRKSA